MKVAALLLLIFNVIVALAAAAFIATYSVVETGGPGGEYLILKTKQAQECRDGGGCAVFSHREWVRSVEQIISQMRRNSL